MIISKRAENIAFDIKDTLAICQELLAQKPEHVFLTAFWENWKPTKTLKWADNFFKHHGIAVTWIINHWSKDDPEWKTFKNPVVFFDFVLWRIYNEVIVKKKNAVNTAWNPDADWFLFLTGKPDKLQRIGLLYKLYKHRLLDKCNYSLFMNAGMLEKSRKYIPELSTQEFELFVKRHTRNPDKISYLEQPDSLHYGGIPYDAELYSTALFKIISETYMDTDPPCVTEKVWLTLLNRSPFIIAGDLNICKYLQSRGIETFDNIFNIPTYDNVVNKEDRLEHIVAHAKQWLSRNFDKVEIANMVEKNYNRFVELALAEKAHIENSTGYSIDLVVDTCDFLAGETK